MSTPQQLKLPKRLENDFDRKILDQFRQWEKVVRKIAAFENHLHFTLHCKHHGVFPTSLTLKCSMKGKKANNIIIRAQKGLMNQRITWINGQLEYYKRIRTDADEYLFTSLPGDVYEEVGTWMEVTRKREFDRIRDRQKAKYQKISLKQRKTDEDTGITKVSSKEKQDLRSKWVVNLSDRTLTDEEKSLLQKGMNFAVTPTSVPVKDYVIGIESACRLIGPYSKQADRLRSDCVRLIKDPKLPKSNITKKEQNALNTLAKDDNIMILPADKGRAVVVMNTKDYHQKAKALLSDETTYKILQKDPTAQFTSKIVNVLKDIKQTGVMDERTYRRLYST